MLVTEGWPWGRVLIARDRLLLLPNVGIDVSPAGERFRLMTRFDNTDLLAKNGGGNDSTQCNRHSWFHCTGQPARAPIKNFDGYYCELD